MKSPRNIIGIVVVALALAVAFVIVGGIPWGRQAQAPVGGPVANNGNATSTAATSTVRTFLPNPPHGAVTYEIAEAATELPAFVQATIDPADAEVGQVQHFTVITNDPYPITSVVAKITTDHKTITVPLTSQGAPAVSMLVPRTLAVGADGQVALLTPGKNQNPGASDMAAGNSGNVANAANTNDTEFTGQWTVEDTHTTRYKTTFIATDSQGNVNSVDRDWTDALCNFASTNNYSGGTVTQSTDCALPTNGTAGVSTVDGPENGNLTISAGNMTLNAYDVLVINSGYTLTITGGNILLTQGANPSQIVFGKDMCGTDVDGDHYIVGSNWTATASANCTGTLRSRVNLSGLSDCDDNDVNAYPGSGYRGGAKSSGGTGTWDYNCDGTVETSASTEITSCSPVQHTYQTGCTYNVCDNTGANYTSVTSANCGQYYGNGCGNGSYNNGCTESPSSFSFLQNMQSCVVNGSAQLTCY